MDPSPEIIIAPVYATRWQQEIKFLAQHVPRGMNQIFLNTFTVEDQQLA
jgi:hypothetical protein